MLYKRTSLKFSPFFSKIPDKLSSLLVVLGTMLVVLDVVVVGAIVVVVATVDAVFSV